MEPSKLSLRDYFAAMALAGLIPGYDFEMCENSASKNRTGFDDTMPNEPTSGTYAQMLATDAYLIADAMVAASQRKPT